MLPEFELHKGRDIFGVSPCIAIGYLSNYLNIPVVLACLGKVAGNVQWDCQ